MSILKRIFGLSFFLIITIQSGYCEYCAYYTTFGYTSYTYCSNYCCSYSTASSSSLACCYYSSSKLTSYDTSPTSYWWIVFPILGFLACVGGCIAVPVIICCCCKKNITRPMVHSVPAYGMNQYGNGSIFTTQNTYPNSSFNNSPPYSNPYDQYNGLNTQPSTIPMTNSAWQPQTRLIIY